VILTDNTRVTTSSQGEDNTDVESVNSSEHTEMHIAMISLSLMHPTTLVSDMRRWCLSTPCHRWVFGYTARYLAPSFPPPLPSPGKVHSPVSSMPPTMQQAGPSSRHHHISSLEETQKALKDLQRNGSRNRYEVRMHTTGTPS
jgi:hypothetical protein